MNKIKIVLLTMDKVYAAYFSNYMINPENGKKFSSKVFTELKSFKENTRNQKQHILITDIQLELDDKKAFDHVIYLSESQVSQDKEMVIFKYQPLNELLSQILAIYYETNGKLAATMNGEQKESVISFYSSSGGVGKTLLSLCLGKYLSLQNKRVFYLNLEQLHTTNLYFKEEKPSSAEIFYYLKNNKERLISKIESLKSRDSLTNIDYFFLPSEPEEMEIITSEQIQTLIQALKETQNYDYIIVDLDCSLHERNAAVLENSNEVFWLLASEETSFSRSQNVLDHDLLGISLDISKVHFILNKIGQQVFEGFNNYNFSIEDRISFNQQWLELNEDTKLQQDSQLGERLSKLLKSYEHPLSGVTLLGN